MNDSIRDLLRQGADVVTRPNLDVEHLVAEADGRLRRRRLAAAITSALAVTVVAAGGLVALAPEARDGSPAPEPTHTPSVEPAPVLGETVYFAAASSGGDSLTAPTPSIEDDADLYVSRVGGQVTRVVATEGNERCPRVSPGGDWLAYVVGPRQELGAADLVVVPLDSAGYPEPSGRRVLLQDGAGDCPAWSPDGRFLAVLAGDTTYPDLELRVVRPDGDERALVDLPAGLIPHVAWSPNGDRLAYTTEDSVFTVGVEGGAPERLWRGTSSPDAQPGGLPVPGAPRSLAWLGSGDIAVSALVRFTESGEDDELHFVDPETGRARTADGLGGQASGGSWSPDGSRLVFVDGSEEGPLRMYDRTSGRTTTLRPKLPGVEGLMIYDVAWSRDGDRLLAGAARNAASAGAAFALVSMAPDGTDAVRLTPWTNALYYTYLDQVS